MKLSYFLSVCEGMDKDIQDRFNNLGYLGRLSQEQTEQIISHFEYTYIIEMIDNAIQQWREYNDKQATNT